MGDVAINTTDQITSDQADLDRGTLNEPMLEENSSGEDSSLQPVVRASNFVHVDSDSVFVFDLGKDLEISHFRIDPAPLAMGVEPNEKGTAMRVQVRQQMLEVARVRTSPGAAVQLAMSILQVLNEKGVLKQDELREGIIEMIGNFGSSSISETV